MAQTFDLAAEAARETAAYLRNPITYAVQVWRNSANGWVTHRAFDGEPNFKTVEQAEKRRGLLSSCGNVRVVKFEGREAE